MNNTPLDGLDLNLLVTLQALLREQSVSRAAVALGSTQPSVSRALAQLRSAFADPLLVRTGRGMVSTPVAEALAVPLDQALAALGRLKSLGAFSPENAQRQFQLLMPDVLGCGIAVELAQRLGNYPGLGACISGAEREAVALLLSGQTELVAGAVKLEHPDLYSKTLPSEVSWSVIRSRQKGRRLKRLKYQTWLKAEHAQLVPSGLPNLHSELELVLKERSESRSVRMRVQQLSGLGEIVENTQLLASLPTPTARWLSKHWDIEVFAHPLRELPKLSVRLSWHGMYHQDPGHQWFRNLVSELLLGFMKEE